MKRALRWIFIPLSVLLTSIIIAVAVLTTTTAGLHWSIKLAQQYLPGELTVDYASGYILGDMELKDVSYVGDQWRIKLKQGHINWNPGSLILSALNINKLEVNGLEVISNNSSSGASYNFQQWQTSDVTLPLQIIIQKASLRDLSYNQTTINAIELRNINLGQNRLTGDIEAGFQGYHAELVSAGSPDDYQMQTVIDGPDLQLNSQLEGQNWHINISDFTAKALGGVLSGEGRLNLHKPLKWQLNLQGKDFNIHGLAPQHQSDLAFDISFQGQGQQWTYKLDRLHGSLDEQPIDGSAHIRHSNAGFNDINLALTSNQAKARISGRKLDQWDLNYQIDIPDLSTFKPQWAGRVQSMGSITGKKNRPYFKGHLQGHNLLIADYSLGHHNARFHAHYNGQAYRGSLQSKGEVTELGVSYDPLTVQLHGNNKAMNAQGFINTGNGPLNLQSTVRFNPFRLEASISGQQVLAMDTHQYRIYLSPDIDMIYKPRHLTVNGQINIPQGRIREENTTSVTSMPDDVVYVDELDENQAKTRNQSDQSSDSLHSIIDLGVDIGPKVKLDYMGVKGELAGNVHISQQQGRSLQGEGQIKLVDAKYKAYGQNLTIDPGLIVFNQSPLDNPNLDIRAIRKITAQTQSVNDIYNANVPANVATTQKTLKVGVHVKGTAQQPEIDLFSIPAGYRDADILAMLLTGSSANELQQSGQSALIMEAAQLINNQTLKDTQSLTGKLVDSIGLEQTDTNGGNGSPLSGSKLTVGKYVQPNLYVSYSVGLGDPSNQVKVRYNLGHNWQIQTEANPSDAGIDLFYTIER